jgi:hypothetical protein
LAILLDTTDPLLFVTHSPLPLGRLRRCSVAWSKIEEIMTTNLDSVLNRFRAASANFIEIVDSAPKLERDEFMTSLNRSLGELYSSALCLPVVEPDTANVDVTPFAIEKFVELRETLQGKFGSLDVYWGIVDSTEKSEPAQASLAGDISEIYFDLKESS